MLGWRERLYSRQSSPDLPQYLNNVVDLVTSTLLPALTSEEAPPTSVLLYGPRGCGKSLVSQQALRVLSNEVKCLNHITLHGLLHSTPIRAWRHVAASLQRFDASQQDDLSTAAVEQCLGVISNALEKLCEREDAVLFVIDEFERFVTSSDGMSQTVLYSLLNLLQDARFRAACIVMTTAIDVTDGLEKRVKSRFTHRQIVMPLPTDATQVVPWIKGALLGGPDPEPRRSRKRPQVSRASTSRKLALSPIYKKSIAEHARLTHFLKSFIDAEDCSHLIDRKLARSRVLAPVLDAIDAALTSVLSDGEAILSEQNDQEMEHMFAKAISAFEENLFPSNATRDMLFTLSALELALLVALKKRESDNAKYDDSKRKLTFCDVFSEYESMSTPGRGMIKGKRDGEPTLPRDVAEKAWERLIECGLVVRIGCGPRDLRACYLAVEAATVDDVLQNHSLASTAMRKWGQSP
ncbi:Origin recognition complex subunit 4 [Gracilaria domingensis]|nr:Origin recognition complex subunit 4 [Gracilaria domingensis]